MAVAEDARQRVGRSGACEKRVHHHRRRLGRARDPFAGGSNAETRKATLTISLDARGERPRKQGIENQIRAALETLPGVRTKVGLGGSARSTCWC